MKKKSIIALLLALIMCFGLCACGESDSGDATSTNTTQEETEATEPSIQDIKIGETITTETFELTVDSIEFSYQEESSDTSSYHSVFNAESGQVYVVVRGQYKNIDKRDHMVSDLPNIAVIYDEDYTYKGQGMIDDGTQFLYNSANVAATPLQTRDYLALADCPEEVKTGDGTAIVYLSDGENLWQYKLK